MRLIAVVILSVAACFLLTPSAPAWAADTGRVEGLLVVSPAAPVSRAGEPNERPMQGRVEAIDRQGDVVAGADSDEAGAFRLDLLPGDYMLHVVSKGSFGHGKDEQITVVAGQITKATLSYDIGIR